MLRRTLRLKRLEGNVFGYDFFKDEFDENCRVPYKLMRWWFLESANKYCRSIVRVSATLAAPWASEYVWAYEQFEGAFARPIEKLMLEVLVLTAVAGRVQNFDEFEKFHFSKISEILSDGAIETLLGELQGDELQEFTQDLKRLRIV